MTDKDPPNLGLLIKLMKLTASPNDAEALLAVRKANEQLLKFGGDWERLLTGRVTITGDPFLATPVPTQTWTNRRQATAPARPQPRPAAPPPPPPPTAPRQPYSYSPSYYSLKSRRRRPVSKPTIDDVFNSL